MNPLACLYHSFTEFKVLFLVKSNMNKMATASLLTSGSMDTNSRWPPRSQIFGCQPTFQASFGYVPYGRVAVWFQADALNTMALDPCSQAQAPRDDSPKM